MKIRPLQDRVIVKRQEEEQKTKGGIIIPETAKEKPIEGKVIAVGNGKILEDGKVRPLDVKKGDRILFSKYAGHRDQGRRRGAAHDARGRHPRHRRELARPPNPFEPPETPAWLPRKSCSISALARRSSRASTPWPTRSRPPSAPRAATSSSRRASARPTITKDGVTVAKEIELENKFENMGAQMVKEVASKTSDVAGDGTTTATVLAQAIYREGSKLVAAGHNPMEIKRGIEKAVEVGHRRAEEALQADQGPQGDRPGRHHLRQRRHHHRQHHRRGDGEGGQGGRHHGRGGQGPRDHARHRRGHAVRPRLPLAVLRHRRRAHGGRPRGRLHPHQREEDHQHEGPAPAAGADRPRRQAPAHHLRGDRGRGAGHPGGQQAARHAARLRRQGPGLRRPPQGHAGGHRHPHRRPAHRRGARRQARAGDPEAPGPRQAHHGGQGQHHHRRRRRQEGGHRGPGEDHPRPDRGDHLRLRQGEAAGAAGQAGRRRRRHQRRRGHRGRDEGEEGPRRGRAPRHPRGGRGGHRPRRRRRLPALPQGLRQP